MVLKPYGRSPVSVNWHGQISEPRYFVRKRFPAIRNLRWRLRALLHFKHSEVLIPALLFIVTVLSTLMAGAMQRSFYPEAIWDNPALLLAGLPFSATLLLILGAHELGHYFASRFWGVDASLPYFIPAPTLFGTFGAVIRIKSPIMSRKVLLDVAVAGPLAGMFVALPAVLIGLSMSSVLPAGAPDHSSGLGLGSSLLFKVAMWAVLGARDAGEGVSLHPVAFAGWCGFFVTSLNLIPAGQLDGGHIVFSLFSRWHRTVSTSVGGLLMVMSYWWPGWLLWAVVALFLGRRRYPLWDPGESLGKGRILLGYSCMILMLLTFTWVPLYIHW